jgi:acyl dehydratase
MNVSTRHVLQQGPVVRALIRTGIHAAKQKRGQLGVADFPGPEFTTTVAPRPAGLVKDYIRHCGGSASWYKGTVPAHLFPQWAFPLLTKTMVGIPYDLTKVLNGGCRIEVHRPLPAGEALQLRAQLIEVDDNGRRAVLKQRIITGTKSAPNALTCYMYAIVPLKRDKANDTPKQKKEKARVADDAREIGRWKLHKKSGLEFAVLTGDFNPVHWIPPYARAAGFRNCILHGFSTLARGIENLNRVVLAGDVNRLSTVDVKFTRPLLLPNKVGLFLEGPRANQPVPFSVGKAPGGPAYLTGTYELTGADNG